MLLHHGFQQQWTQKGLVTFRLSCLGARWTFPPLRTAMYSLGSRSVPPLRTAKYSLGSHSVPPLRDKAAGHSIPTRCLCRRGLRAMHVSPTLSPFPFRASGSGFPKQQEFHELAAAAHALVGVVALRQGDALNHYRMGCKGGDTQYRPGCLVWSLPHYLAEWPVAMLLLVRTVPVSVLATSVYG